MATLLVTTLPHEGHLNPTFPIARKLAHAGHEIHYLDHPRIRHRLRTEGFPTVPYRPLSPADTLMFWRIWRLARAHGLEESRQAIMLFTTRLEVLARYIQSVIRQLQPALIINDVFNYGTRLAAELAGIPWVDCWTAGLMHASEDGCTSLHSREDLTQLSDLFDRRMNSVRRALELPAQEPGAFLRPSPWLQLYCTCAELEPPHPDPGPGAVYVGPSFSGRREDSESGFLQDWFQGSQPLIYVSLGTFFNKRADFFHRIVDAFTGIPVQVVVSSPLATSRSFRALPPNIRFFQRVPQTELLRRADLFLSHGGNNSVNESLALGVPLLITPVGGEQEANAVRVEWLGAGLSTELEQADAGTLRRLALQIIDTPRYKENAVRAQTVLKRCDAAAVSASLIQRILETGEPLQRPPGAPLTLYNQLPLPAWATKER
ncbi:hypothetical protein MNBD_GAMMA14-1374 [hydrothermal vent metagenome]|uniref:Glycosyltransferase, MGT family n=1 Tax=hydrothermal vent metagenome TaxID=652676 RepID=A0A3B0Y7W6_9ZZZZ